ncbi:MAG: DUF2007 domain-containing protein [Xanthobacteraceae bacterium]|nr:DUF2007 domain-containing protein [Xanthobacteraceae bacterium]
MDEIVRTNDVVLISAIEALFKSANIPYFIADQHMSVMDGSLGFLPRRVLVGEDYFERAKRLLTDAGLGNTLKSD